MYYSINLLSILPRLASIQFSALDYTIFIRVLYSKILYYRSLVLISRGNIYLGILLIYSFSYLVDIAILYSLTLLLAYNIAKEDISSPI